LNNKTRATNSLFGAQLIKFNILSAVAVFRSANKNSRPSHYVKGDSMKLPFVGFAISCSAFLMGCAQHAADISAMYVSPITYENYSCVQIREEAARLSAKATQVAGVQDSKATNDAVATGVGVILFWPALLMIKGDSTTAAELSQLKGQMEAVEQASIQKKCGIEFQKPPAKP
jgi:hypothetical protein